jgi:hypothetical protein
VDDDLVMERTQEHAVLMGPARPAPNVTTKTCQNVNTESCRHMCKQRGR